MFSRKSSVGLSDGLPISSSPSVSAKASMDNLRGLGRNTSLNYKKPRHYTSQQYASGAGAGGERSVSNDAGTVGHSTHDLSRKSSIGDFGNRILSQHKERKNEKYLEKEIARFNDKYRMNSSTSSSHHSKGANFIRKSSKRIISEVTLKDFKKKSKLKKCIVIVILIVSVYQFLWKLLLHSGTSISLGGRDGNNAFQFKSRSVDEIPLSERFFNSKNQVSKIQNEKFKLNIPFLDTVYNNYKVGGHPIVKNKDYVRMIQKGDVGKHSVLLSKETLPNDFEIQISMVLEPGNHKITDSKKPGDGINFFFTKLTKFLDVDPTSYSQRQFMIQNDNIDPKNMDLMGIPKNIPSESLVLDFFNNGKITNIRDEKWDQLETPHLSLLSTVPGNDYDFHDDGVSNAHDIVKLSSQLLYTERGAAEMPKEVKLRIIKVSDILFKVDIDYTGFGFSWLEVLRFEKFGDKFPNLSTGQVHFGISAYNGDQTANFQINRLDCFNYVWNNPTETNPDVKIEDILELYRREYDVLKIDGWFDIKSLYGKSGILPRELKEADQKEYLKKRAKASKSKPMQLGNVTPRDGNNSQIDKKKRTLVGKLLLLTWIILICGVLLYVVSLFLRVQKKKFKAKRSASNGLL